MYRERDIGILFMWLFKNLYGVRYTSMLSHMGWCDFVGELVTTTDV